jgi:hypothetical protein
MTVSAPSVTHESVTGSPAEMLVLLALNSVILGKGLTVTWTEAVAVWPGPAAKAVSVYVVVLVGQT